MHASLLLLSAMASLVVAAPTTLELNAVSVGASGDMAVLGDYFNNLARKVQEGRALPAAPVCDVSKAQQPVAPTPLPPPAQGAILKHIAVGRGVQNYTCDMANSTAVPVAAGAVATLYNATCVTSTYPDLANNLPRVALQFKTTPIRLAPATNLLVSGQHYFTTLTTPFFDLDTGSVKLGHIPCAKNASSPAPADAQKGLQGEAAVPWLKLVARDGATGGLMEVYRLETAGGSAPATCAGQQATFSVQYAAQYWFYEKPTA